MNKKLILGLFLLLIVVSACGERLAARRALKDQQLNQPPTEPSNIGEVQDDLGLNDAELEDVMSDEGDAELEQVDEELSELDNTF